MSFTSIRLLITPNECISANSMLNKEINHFASISFVINEIGTHTNWQQSFWQSWVALALKAHTSLGRQLNTKFVPCLFQPKEGLYWAKATAKCAGLQSFRDHKKEIVIQGDMNYFHIAM